MAEIVIGRMIREFREKAVPADQRALGGEGRSEVFTINRKMAKPAGTKKVKMTYALVDVKERRQHVGMV